MKKFKDETTRELVSDILPFWMDAMADPEGGFFGRMDGKGRIHPDAEKGAILNARILWTFSAAWRILKKPEYLETAGKACRYMVEHFIDREFGGVYWSLNADGSPKDTKKQFYAIAFTIYALAEYFRAAGDKTALEEAQALFRCIEDHSLDRLRGGYIEACSRDWRPIEDMRLSDKDQNDAKTMNTHLHILEAYTALCRVWKGGPVADALKGVTDIFLERIIRPDGHLQLFFDEGWNATSTVVSYGHGIEASWLLCEAADVLGDGTYASRVKAAAAPVAEAAMEGFTPGSGMSYEFDPATGTCNHSREWWVQAETVLGCLNMFQLTGDSSWKEKAESQWGFIRDHLICPDGEWYWGVLPSAEGFVPNLEDDRAGFWKCPYHNGRMCMEIIERFPD